MAITKATTNKGKYKRNPGPTTTDDGGDNWLPKKSAVDLGDENKPFIKLSLCKATSIVLTIISLAAAAAWFIAAEWHYDTRCKELGNSFSEDLNDKLNEFKENNRNDYYSKEYLENYLGLITNNTGIMNCLKSKGYFSKECFK